MGEQEIWSPLKELLCTCQRFIRGQHSKACFLSRGREQALKVDAMIRTLQRKVRDLTAQVMGSEGEEPVRMSVDDRLLSFSIPMRNTWGTDLKDSLDRLSKSIISDAILASGAKPREAFSDEQRFYGWHLDFPIEGQYSSVQEVSPSPWSRSYRVKGALFASRERAEVFGRMLLTFSNYLEVVYRAGKLTGMDLLLLLHEGAITPDKFDEGMEGQKKELAMALARTQFTETPKEVHDAWSQGEKYQREKVIEEEVKRILKGRPRNEE